MNLNTKKINEMDDKELNTKFGIFGFSFKDGKPYFFSLAKFNMNVEEMANNPKYVASLGKEEVFAILGWAKEFLGKDNFNGFKINTLRYLARLIKCGKEYGLCEWTYSSDYESSIKEYSDLFRAVYVDAKNLDLTDSEAFAKHFIDKIKPSVLKPDDIKTFFLLCNTEVIGRFDKKAFDVFKNYALASGKIDANLALIMIGLADNNNLDMTEVVDSFIDKLEINEKDGRLNPEYLNGVINKFIVSYSAYYSRRDNIKANDNHSKKIIQKGKLLEKLVYKLAELGCSNLLDKSITRPEEENDRGGYKKLYSNLATRAIENAKNKKIELSQKDNPSETEIKTIVKKTVKAKTWVKDEKTERLVEESKEIPNTNNVSKTFQIPEIFMYYENKFNELRQRYQNDKSIRLEIKNEIIKLLDEKKFYTCLFTKEFIDKRISQIEGEIKDILAKDTDREPKNFVYKPKEISDNCSEVGINNSHSNGDETEKNMNEFKNVFDDSLCSVSTQDDDEPDISDDILKDFDNLVCTPENTEKLEFYLKKASDKKKRELATEILSDIKKSFENPNKNFDSVKNGLLNVVVVIANLNKLCPKTKQYLVGKVNETSDIALLEKIFAVLKNIVNLILGETTVKKIEAELKKEKSKNIFGQLKKAKDELVKRQPHIKSISENHARLD